jgi:2-oxoglutarate dehydrogenase E2 component (dihydrolipoamide succinyltransferase)
MLVDVTMPQLGESVSEGTLSKWRVKEGDPIEKDAPLVEIATDKADSEVPSPVTGRVAKILVHEGETVAVKTLLCQIDEGASAGEAKAADDKAVDVVDTKATEPQPRPPTNPPPRQAERPAALETQVDLRNPWRSATGKALAPPGARREALEQGIDLDTVRGSGDHGRITRDDVLRAGSHEAQALATMATAPPRTEPPASMRVATPPPLVRSPPPEQPAQAIRAGGGFPVPGIGFGAFKVPVYRPNDGDKVVPFTRRRRITADHMTYSKVVSPHVVTVAEVDLHKAGALRDRHKDRYKKEGHALTMLAFVAFATAKAIRENPQMNTRMLDDAYVLLKDIHLGVAVDSPDGLVVPVVRHADELGVRGIVRAIDELATRARTGKITADDLSGATFSITNPGVKGNLFGGAIINQPNSGILRMGEIQKRVVVVQGKDGDDQMAIHPVMYLALSYDHRIVDGVAANSFLWRVTELLEQGEFEV